MVEADWQIRGSGESASSHYMLEKAELLSIDKCWRAAGFQFLRSTDDKIDVRELAISYTPRVKSFYSWFLTEFEGQHFWALDDFRRCRDRKMALSSAQEWHFFLQICLKSKAPIDPYRHLPRYLTSEQIESTAKFPRHSKEQVDYIISILDTWSAATDEIRKMAYELFRRKTFVERAKGQAISISRRVRRFITS